ncbi:MAG: hypothetical protein ACK5HP_00035 [Bacilli bacterium]
MNLENNLIWILFGENNFGYVDGEVVSFPAVTNVRHLELLKKFCSNNEISLSKADNEIEYAKGLAELNMAVFINSGKATEDKYFGIWLIPELLTTNQISKFEELKSLFVEKYDSKMFKTPVITTSCISYKSNISGCRDLAIESIIDGTNIKNGIELLYKELEQQKVLLSQKNK